MGQIQMNWKKWNIPWWIFVVLLLVILFTILLVDWNAISNVYYWFDPILFYYNFLLTVVAILAPLVITVVYTREMRDEKQRRLRGEIGEDAWPNFEKRIEERLDHEFQFSSYVGSLSATMLVTAFGAGILLLMKPIPLGLDLSVLHGTPGKHGVDFTKGASFLMLGPFMKDIGHPPVFYPNLIISLTAFQFGFLGAWLHFIAHVTRSYFMCDLTPNTFVNGCVRMISGSLFALVLSFFMPLLFEGGTDSDDFLRVLPVVSVFFGYFPSRAILVIENIAGKVLAPLQGRKKTDASVALSTLPGISNLHEVRLTREGIDNVENLSEFTPLDLAFRTGFSFKQLDHWIGQAWLRMRLGKDYESFVSATGIVSRGDLTAFLQNWDPTPPHHRAQDLLKAALDQSLHVKIEVICTNTLDLDGSTHDQTSSPPVTEQSTS